jgi:hypothetical protein
MTTPSSGSDVSHVPSAHDLAAELEHFTGTEHYYRHALARGVVYTDGVKYFADKAGAYWLLDIVATELPKFVLKHRIIFVTCSVKSGKAKLSANADAGKSNLWERDINFTDCPEGDWLFYMAGGGDAHQVVILLPTEY